MTINIRTNVPSLLAQRNLAQSSDRLNTAFERLSSGLRINRAKDDAARQRKVIDDITRTLG